ncbi:phage tail protein [Bilophila wadsworthia]|uniref:phage tail protein n=1 Tax=Bilophila wadsworthia TaxID=35833 RepID=UPI00068EF4F3|nr:phage tail protein [Bilophila wadsworthia]
MKRLLLLFLLCFGLALPWVAADGTSFNPTTISVKSVGASIPVGTVITWPSNSWPSDRDNWLECNGQSISSAVYPELTSLVGSRVPDYRGIFLRGHGSQVSTHYGTVTHTSAGLGELQGDAIRNISGTFGGHIVGWREDGGTAHFTPGKQTTVPLPAVSGDQARRGGLMLHELSPSPMKIVRSIEA